MIRAMRRHQAGQAVSRPEGLDHTRIGGRRFRDRRGQVKRRSSPISPLLHSLAVVAAILTFTDPLVKAGTLAWQSSPQAPGAGQQPVRAAVPVSGQCIRCAGRGGSLAALATHEPGPGVARRILGTCRRQWYGSGAGSVGFANRLPSTAQIK